MRLIRNPLTVFILLGVVGIIGMRVSAPYRHNREFTSKLSYFQKIISDLQTSGAAPPASFIKVPVPDGDRDMAYSILAERLGDGRLAVEFLTGGGFPVKHRGFLYLSSGSFGDFPQMASRWPKRTPLRDHWLYIGD